MNVATASPLPVADPRELDFIPDRLARLRPALQRFVDDGNVPNLVTLVARHGQVVHFDAQGYADLDARRNVEKDSIFRLSTVADYARFGQMLLNGGELDGVRLLGRKTVELMTSYHSEGILMPSPTGSADTPPCVRFAAR